MLAKLAFLRLRNKKWQKVNIEQRRNMLVLLRIVITWLAYKILTHDKTMYMDGHEYQTGKSRYFLLSLLILMGLFGCNSQK